MNILIVGREFTGLIDHIKSIGANYCILRDKKLTKVGKEKDKYVYADFSSRETILAALESLPWQPDACATIYENYVLPAAIICEYYGLPGMPVASAEACTDKYLMRSLFAKAPESISPDFAEATSLEVVKDFAAKHDFPLILKPANLAKSLLVTKSSNLSELIENYQRTVEHINAVYAQYAPDRQPKIVIEEFLEGTVHSVDAFVDSDGTPHVMKEIVDYQTGYDVGYDDNFHYSRIMPSKLSDEEQAKFLHCAELGCRALGMKNSPAHIEIIMTAKGPRIVEIGARNGGYRERMYRLACGINTTENALKVWLGQQPEIVAQKHEPIAVLELFPKVSGNFAGIAHQKELEQLPSLEYLSVKPAPGAYIGKSSDGYKMAAVVILHHSDAAQFNQDLDFVNRNVYVITETTD
ncbi:ATP-grasp domain-containing protein [Candidatus Saccharibacteria bacterium]|nr:ATP-grasp domain-containing protein [Candidatus Saccharibacteria bacterium]